MRHLGDVDRQSSATPRHHESHRLSSSMYDESYSLQELGNVLIGLCHASHGFRVYVSVCLCVGASVKLS